MHTLERTINIPISLSKAWEFFADPKNLKVITPDYMGFDITSKNLSEEMYPDMIITYSVTQLLKIPMNWMTEITHVVENKFFVDEQKVGPYSIWHHQHHFKEIEGGVEMKDLITYVLPLGLIGRILEPFIVSPKLKEIFDYREKKMLGLFGKFN